MFDDLGTTERVCLITGTVEAVRKVHNFIMDKIREKPDTNPKPLDGDLKVNFERHKQVLIFQNKDNYLLLAGIDC